MKRIITLPNGNAVGLASYVRAWRTLKQLAPDAQVKAFDWHPSAARDVLRDLHYGMHDRINRHVPSYGQGRKWDSNWFWAAKRLSREVNTPRLIVRWIPQEFRARLTHRIWQED